MVNLRSSSAGHIEFNESVERILEGMRLVKRGIADRLFIVGGSGNPFDQRASEARILRSFALEFSGLHDEQVLTEEFSRNTYENAVKATEDPTHYAVPSPGLDHHGPAYAPCCRRIS